MRYKSEKSIQNEMYYTLEEIKIYYCLTDHQISLIKNILES